MDKILVGKISPSVSFGHQQVSPAEKRELVQEHFNTVASRYDLTNTLLSFGQQVLWKRQAVKLLHLQLGKKFWTSVAVPPTSASWRPGPCCLPARYWSMILTGPCWQWEKRRLTGQVCQIGYSVCKESAENIALPDNTFAAVMVGFGIRNLISMEQGLKRNVPGVKTGWSALDPGIFATHQFLV